jgi:hypothetical protein
LHLFWLLRAVRSRGLVAPKKWCHNEGMIARILAYMLATGLVGCGGSQFETGQDRGTTGGTGGATGGAAGRSTGGSAGAAAGSGGTSGAAASGGNSAVDAGADSSAGAADSGGNAGADAGTDSSGGATPITVVRASDTMLSTDEIPTLTFDPPPRAGNAIIVGVTCISDYLGDCTVPSGVVTDNHANTYVRVVQGEPIRSSAQAARGYIFIAQDVVATNIPLVISVNPDGTTVLQAVAWGAIEVSGLAPAPSLDAWGVSLAGGTDPNSTVVTTDRPTTQPNELAVAVLSMRSADTNLLITPETSWVEHHVNQNNASGPPGHSMVSKVLSSTGIVSHAWSHDVPSRGVAAVIATFVGAAQN